MGYHAEGHDPEVLAVHVGLEDDGVEDEDVEDSDNYEYVDSDTSEDEEVFPVIVDMVEEELAQERIEPFPGDRTIFSEKFGFVCSFDGGDILFNIVQDFVAKVERKRRVTAAAKRKRAKLIEKRNKKRATKEKKRGDRLASSRVMRDNLMHQMEAIVLQEAELGSALELLDYTRQKCDQQHDAIVQRLESCEEMLKALENGAAAEVPVESLLDEEEHRRWKQTKEMVTTILPEVLTRLEDNIELNNAKIRDVRDKMEELRSKRLALREEIAVKEEDIALMLNE
ncbi:hypothetical protein PC118_g15620 [Phytophthora cactorum]|nr:hypothetical protein PC118_g15620 [Phytophthora cactorum]